MKSKPELWDSLETHWTEYAKENSRNCYERVVPSSTGVDGVEDGDSAQDSDDEGACELLLPGDQGYNDSSVTVEGNNGGEDNVAV